MTPTEHVPPPTPNEPLGAVQVLANREGLTACLALTERLCTQWALAGEDAQAVRLAVEEACSNVVEHGYAGQPPGPLTLAFHLVAPDVLEAQVCDQAQPFHPSDAPQPDLLSDSDDRPIGGLGWFFIQQVMTEVTYTSQASGNCLCLRRKLASPVAAPAGGNG